MKTGLQRYPLLHSIAFMPILCIHPHSAISPVFLTFLPHQFLLINVPKFIGKQSIKFFSNNQYSMKQGTHQVGSKSFACKLYKSLQNLEYQEYIDWSQDGLCVIIKNVPGMIANVLPVVFKHQNYSSFVRQLNTYGFMKISHEGTHHIYRNQLFTKLEKPNFNAIHRKNVQKQPPPIPVQIQAMMKTFCRKIEQLESKLLKKQRECQSTILGRIISLEKGNEQLSNKTSSQQTLLQQILEQTLKINHQEIASVAHERASDTEVPERAEQELKLRKLDPKTSLPKNWKQLSLMENHSKEYLEEGEFLLLDGSFNFHRI